MLNLFNMHNIMSYYVMQLHLNIGVYLPTYTCNTYNVEFNYVYSLPTLINYQVQRLLSFNYVVGNTANITRNCPVTQNVRVQKSTCCDNLFSCCF